jgi:Flp pilus assembly pilin Flp
MVQFIDAWLGLYARDNRNDEGATDRHAGQGLIEYALLIWFIAIVVFVAVLFLREKIDIAYSKIGNSIPN